ncbi:MAG TPA: phosphatase PAP2 family protein [Abditibacteriaceae bacterium]|jgi:hypothetical protein
MFSILPYRAALAAATFSLCWLLLAQAQQASSQTALSSPFALSAASPVNADSPGDSHLNAASFNRNSGGSEARFASGTGSVIYIAAGTLLPLLEDEKDGKDHSLRTADSLLTSTLITEALKRLVGEKRPDDSARTSFPSGHATAAFAVATMQAHFHPKQALLWYGGATLIAASRVQLHRHYVHDVVAGAAVGYLTSRFELSRPRGLILAPFIKSRKAGGNGLSFNMSF